PAKVDNATIAEGAAAHANVVITIELMNFPIYRLIYIIVALHICIVKNTLSLRVHNFLVLQ
ncbi:hypothetical protein KAJ27_10545, partial [bacterium]|nr:hypothetical protein [bacterium]